MCLQFKDPTGQERIGLTSLPLGYNISFGENSKRSSLDGQPLGQEAPSWVSEWVWLHLSRVIPSVNTFTVPAKSYECGSSFHNLAKCMAGCVGQNNVPQGCIFPNSQNLWMCYLTWQRGACEFDWVKILRWGDYAGLFECAQYEREREILKCYPAGFEDGGRGHEPRNVSNFWKLAKVR